MEKRVKRIYFVRHGLTSSNVLKRMMGSRVDEGLNEVGIEQAKTLAQTLEKDFDIIISSPLKRAQETAEIIGKFLATPVIVDGALRERDAGDLSGLSWLEIADFTKGVLTRPMLDLFQDIDYSAWGGETKEMVRERLTKFKNRIFTEFFDKKMMVVTHAGILRVISAMEGKELPALGNTSVNIIELTEA